MERGGVIGRLQAHHPLQLLGGQDLCPGRAVRRSRAVEGVDQLGVVDRDRLRRHHPLETVLGYRMAAAHPQPALGIVPGQAEEGAHHLAEHRSEIRGRILCIVDLGTQACLADREPLVDGGVRHPYVDAETGR